MAANQSVRGFLLALCGVVWISPDGLIVRLIETDSWTLLFWRGALWALAMAVFLYAQDRHALLARFRALGLIGIAVAALYALSNVAAVTAFTMTTIANTLVILAATPMIAAVFSRIFLREPVPWRTWAAVVVVFCSLAVIFSARLQAGSAVGDFAALFGAFCLATQMTLLRHARAADMLPTVVLSGAFVALAMLPLAAPADISLRDAGLLLLLGLVILPVPTCLLLLAPKYLPPADVGLVRLLEAVLGPLWVWLVLTEVPDTQTMLAGAVILGTLVLHSLAGRHAGIAPVPNR